MKIVEFYRAHPASCSNPQLTPMYDVTVNLSGVLLPSGSYHGQHIDLYIGGAPILYKFKSTTHCNKCSAQDRQQQAMGQWCQPDRAQARHRQAVLPTRPGAGSPQANSL